MSRTQSSGRLVKHNSHLINQLEVLAYPWLDLTEEDAIMSDNPNQSLIRPDLHTAEELEDHVYRPETFYRELRPKVKIHFPGDLTQAYEDSQKDLTKKRRRHMLDEESAIALDLAELDATQIRPSEKNLWKKKKKVKARDTLLNNLLDLRTTPDVETQSQSSKNNTQDTLSPKIDMQKSDSATVSDLTKTLNSQTASTEKAQNSVAPESQKHLDSNDPAAQPLMPPTPPEAGLPMPSQQNSPPVQEKTPDSALPQASASTPPEAAQGHATEDPQATGMPKENADASQSPSSSDGLTAQKDYDQAIAHLGDALAKIQQLQKHALQTTQEFFSEFTKLCCEKILQTQLAYDPKILHKLFLDTVAPHAQMTNIAVDGHAKDLERLKTYVASLPDLAHVKWDWKDNPSASPGQLRVESQSQVTQLNIKKSVEDLMSKFLNDFAHEHEDHPGDSSQATDAGTSKAS